MHNYHALITAHQLPFQTKWFMLYWEAEKVTKLSSASTSWVSDPHSANLFDMVDLKEGTAEVRGIYASENACEEEVQMANKTLIDISTQAREQEQEDESQEFESSVRESSECSETPAVEAAVAIEVVSDEEEDEDLIFDFLSVFLLCNNLAPYTLTVI
jgi:hypothetical protein